jgi:HAD superfamily hydrolase (TIGR01484 family)
MDATRILASDLDGTLIPSDRALIAAFNASVRGRRGLCLAYVTGRHRELALAGIEDHGLARPGFLICDVGTSLYARTADGWSLDSDYASQLAASWHGQDGNVVAEALNEIAALSEQEPERQSRFKRSYYVRGDQDPMASVETARRTLAVRGLEANVIYSEDPATGVGLLDVLPQGASKDSALRHLVALCKLRPDQVVYAGDSENDVPVFLGGTRSIVVGNTPDTVKEQVRAQAVRDGFSDRVYFARAHVLAGVLEGCEHFGVFAG